MMPRGLLLPIALLSVLLVPHPAGAQEDESPTFELSSSETFTTRGHPTFGLGYRHLTQLDFRVYKVRDPFGFFAGLREPHQLGGPAQPVPKERSWIERLTIWKRDQRRELRQFFREQVSYRYRVQRRVAQDREAIQQRVVLNRATFTQVPLLNPDQLVTSWREMLPDYRDFDYRRLPLDIRDEGVYVVEAVSGTMRAYTIVVISNVGLVTKSSPQEMLAFTADRLTGEPIAGCDIQVLAGQRVIGRGRTEPDGVVRLTLPDETIEDAVTVAKCGQRTAVTDAGGYFSPERGRPLVGYIYTDKPIYRPGHTARVKGILRWRERDGLVPFDRPAVEIAVTDTTSKVILRQRLDVDEFGAVNTSVPIPVAATLGDYTIRLISGDATALGNFEVQEYRRPEFEVVVTAATRFVKQGDKAVATVQARYYFGQPVANAKVKYRVSRSSYTSPYRYSDAFGEEYQEFGSYGFGTGIDEGELRLDAEGHGTIQLDTSADTEHPQDYDLTVEATVTDASSRDISNSTTIHATYGTFMLVARVDDYIHRAGQTVPIRVHAVDYTGAPRGNLPVRVVVEHYRNWAEVYRSTAPKPTRVNETRAMLDANGDVTVQVTLGREAGSYRIAVSTPEGDRTITGEVNVYVPGAGVEEDSDDEYVEVVADKKTYVPGDVAQLLVRGQPLSGPVLVTKEGDHVMWHAVLRATAGQPLSVPIDAADAGDVYVSLMSLRDGRIRRAERRLGVSVADRTLTIALTPDNPKAKPQEAATYSVRVTDAAGAPVRAQLSLGVIDEAIYAIKPDTTPDPVRFFHRREYSRVADSYSGSYYFAGYAGNQRIQLAARRRRPFTLADFKGDRETQPQVRKDFSDAIYWIANLVTATDGSAKVTLKYPDQLTTWRLTARAITTDTKAGSGIVRTVTTKDLIVRVITPRFLTEGDRVSIPGIAHNYTDVAKETTLAIDVKGLTVDGQPPAPIVATVPPGGEHRQDWRFIASNVGPASITGSARTDADTDAVELPVSVLPYGLRREAGTSGAIADASEVTAEVSIPSAANAAGRSVQVSLAPSIAGSLLGSLDYLTNYPYGCTEQTLSSFVPNLVVTRALTQLKLTPTERMASLDRQVAAGLNRLMDYQHDDGGWGWWKTDENHPFMTAYAVDGLIAARDAGYSVNAFRLQNAVRSLVRQYADNPTAVPDLKAYLVFVLGRAVGENDSVEIPSPQGPPKAYRTVDALNDLWGARNRMSSYGRALLLLALDRRKDVRGNELAAQLIGEAQTQGELSFWNSENDPLLLDIVDTSVEATATAVRALARRDPRNPILDRAVRWMMLKRSGGYWYSTKQTAMALYGLLELLQARNEAPATFTADVYVNGMLAGSQTFTPATLANPEPVIVNAAGREGTNNVRIVKRGGGTLYWSASSVYFDPTAAEGRVGRRQLAIKRTYQRLESVRNTNGTYSYREAPLNGSVQAGDVLAVHLVIAGSPDWSYLVIEDPLPAGFEGVRDPSGYQLVSEMRFQFWTGARTEYRDDKTVFFEPNLRSGRNEYVYVIKAISGGTFRAVPAQVAPMYVPGIAASSEPFTVTVGP